MKFDPAELSYADLLRVFFAIHDPTTLNRQGNDIGTQYRSIILTHSDAQKQTAEAVRQEIAAAKIWHRPLVTEIVPLQAFYEAEDRTPRLFRAQSVERLLPGGGGAESGEIPQAVHRPAEARGGGVGQLSGCDPED